MLSQSTQLLSFALGLIVALSLPFVGHLYGWNGILYVLASAMLILVLLGILVSLGSRPVNSIQLSLIPAIPPLLVACLSAIQSPKDPLGLAEVVTALGLFVAMFVTLAITKAKLRKR